MGAKIEKRLFSVDDFYRMADAGIIRPEERLELIHGELITMSPIGLRHSAAVDRLNHAFVRLAGAKAIVRVQGTAALDKWCAPQPDLVLLRPRKDFYEARHPTAAETLLIVEVADSSLEYDTTVKKELYAILNVREYWVVDLRANQLIVHRDPEGDSYNAITTYHAGDAIAPRALRSSRIRVGPDVFGVPSKSRRKK
jgi:Uma2 family endonuclease